MLNILEEEPVVEDVTGKDSVAFEGISSENVTFSYEDEKYLMTSQ